MKANKSTKVTKINTIASGLKLGDYFYFTSRCYTCMYKIVFDTAANYSGRIKKNKSCGKCKTIPYDPANVLVTIIRG